MGDHKHEGKYKFENFPRTRDHAHLLFVVTVPQWFHRYGISQILTWSNVTSNVSWLGLCLMMMKRGVGIHMKSQLRRCRHCKRQVLWSYAAWCFPVCSYSSVLCYFHWRRTGKVCSLMLPSAGTSMGGRTTWNHKYQTRLIWGEAPTWSGAVKYSYRHQIGQNMFTTKHRTAAITLLCWASLCCSLNNIYMLLA